MSKEPTKGERRASRRRKARSKKGMRSAGKWFKSSYRDAVAKRLAALTEGAVPPPGAGRD